MNRNQFLEKAGTEYFDVCIIGGGATGAGCALDAQSRGLKTILIEREDFGSGTSSKSTKLIHGGVRYLEQAVKKLSIGQYKMVRKALKERKTLLSIAPHITKPLQLVTPCRTWVEGLYYFIGLKLYDWISGDQNIGSSRLLTKTEAVNIIPTLKRSELFNAVLYYDGQLDDLRFNLALVQTAVEKGAVCLNHCEAIAFEKNALGKLEHLLAEDKLTGQHVKIRAKQFVNATGPFADSIRLLAIPGVKPRIRVSKGVHILLPGNMMPTKAALLIPETKDGRLIFVIPYGDYLLVGTTDADATLATNEIAPNTGELAYLLDYVNEYLDIKATDADVTAGFGGLRPLISADENSTKDLVRDHEVEVDQESGLISILGGKWTTYRLMAIDTIDAVMRQLQLSPKKSATDKIMLLGSRDFDETLASRVMAVSGCDPGTANHLVVKYGDASLEIAALMRQNAEAIERLLPNLPYCYAELEYVVTYEMACTVKDVLNRRWGTQLFNWQQTLDLLPVVGEWMAKHFSWTAEQRILYIDDYMQELTRMKEGMGITSGQ